MFSIDCVLSFDCFLSVECVLCLYRMCLRLTKTKTQGRASGTRRAHELVLLAFLHVHKYTHTVHAQTHAGKHSEAYKLRAEARHAQRHMHVHMHNVDAHTHTQGNHTGLCDMRTEPKSGKCPRMAWT